MEILQPTEEAIEKAARALSNGLLVAFPTETVYGLGANALDLNALQRLYAAKGRPSNHPVIVHIGSAGELANWASSIPAGALALAQTLWPGPLTLILPKASHVPDAVTGGQNSVGLRVPNHPVAQALLRKFQGGIAAPSANKFGRLSPTNADSILQDFVSDEIQFVLDGGFCEVGIESTIVDFSKGQPHILRPGMILRSQIESIIAGPASGPLFALDTTRAASEKTRAPGGLPSHYAPRTSMQLTRSEELDDTIAKLIASGRRIGVLSFRAKGDEPVSWWIEAQPDPHVYARRLYHNLRLLDSEQADVLVVESVPDSAEWTGIRDRLTRASAPVASPAVDSVSVTPAVSQATDSEPSSALAPSVVPPPSASNG